MNTSCRGLVDLIDVESLLDKGPMTGPATGETMKAKFMKTQLFRVSALALAASTLVLGTGCQEERAQAEVPVFTPTPVLAVGAEAEAPQTPAPPNAAPEATPAVKVVQAPVVPDKENLSP